MRIIAGKWRGRVLASPKGHEVRPTTDRTKEALFSILGPQISGSIVLDLCCGAGGLGLEALSRGAKKVFFVDQSRPSLAATRRNLELCGADPESYALEFGDARRWLTRWSGAGGEPWVLLCDPPYQSLLAGGILTDLLAARSPGLWCAVVEHGAATPDLPQLSPNWEIRRYGESRLAVYRPGAAAL